jgi:hypothetical protein
VADARRELIAVAVVSALTAGCAPIVIERWRRTPVDADEAPKLVVFDLGHETEHLNVGSATYTMQIEIEGTVTDTNDGTLPTTTNELYVRVLRSLSDYTLGGLCTDLRETAYVVQPAAEMESVQPLATFTLSIEATFETPDGDPTG